MHRRRVGDQPFFFGVAVEAGHGTQPPGDRRRRPAVGLEFNDQTPAEVETAYYDENPQADAA